MAKFKYEARNKEGAVLKGITEAKTKQDAINSLVSKGLIVVEINEGEGFNFQKLNEINIGGVPMKDKTIFMRQLSTMISAGLPLTQALDILEKQTENPRFQKVVASVKADVSGGVSLSKAFQKYDDSFDAITISLLQAGEESGHLEEILQRVATEMEERKKLGEKIRSAFTYPIIISVVVVAVVILLVTVLVPAMEEIYNEFDSDLPWVTQLLVDISNAATTYWWAFLLGFGLLAVAVKMYLDTEDGKKNFNKILLKIPIFGLLTTKIQVTQFSRVLALLLKSGLSIIDSLELTANSLGNLEFRDAVLAAKKDVESGVPLAAPLARSEVFPLMISQMVAVGEESGEIDMVLDKMAEYYNSEVEVMTTNLTTLLEPIILIVMGVVIGFVAFAVYMPMFSLVEVIG